MNYEKLSEQFKALNFPRRFTLQEIDARLKNRYLAELIDISFFEALRKDPHVHYENGVAAYRIDDPCIIKGLSEIEAKLPNSHDHHIVPTCYIFI